jgi:hypothetical protein
VKATALLLFPLFFLAGCSAFFGFNAFKSLDEPPAPKLSDYQGGSDGLAKLARDLGSPAVVDKLKADPTTTQAIETYLYTYLATPPLDTPDEQSAAILYGDLYLKTTSGDELVNNIVASLVTSTQTGNISSLIASIIPSAVAGNETDFTAMMVGLLKAHIAYQALGAETPPYSVPPGMTMGDIAQKAAVAYLIWAVVDAIENQTVYTTSQEAIAQMYLLTNNQTNGIASVNVSDPFNPLDASLKNIFDAAGAPYPK